MRTTRLFGATLILGGALAASATEQPAATNPTKSAPTAPSANASGKANAATQAPTGNASSKVNAATQAPTSTSGSASGSATTNAAVQPNAGSTAPSGVNAQTGVNTQGSANVGGATVQGGVNAKTNVGASTSTAPNAAAPNTAAGTSATVAPNIAAPKAAVGTSATVAPNSAAGAAVQSQTAIQGQAGLPGQAALNAQTGASALTNFARVSQAVGLGFAPGANGLTLSTISPNSPFSSVGFLPGDQIVSFGGQNFTSPAGFTQYLTSVPVGQQIPVVVMRNGVQQTMYWTPNQQFAQLLPPQGNFIPVTLPSMPLDNLGIQLDRNIPNAAVVAQVAPGSPAQQAGIVAGDAIVAVNDREIHSPGEFAVTVNQLPPNSPINLSLSRHVQQNVQVGPNNAVPVTAARPIAPAAQNVPANQGPVRRIFRRN